MIIAYTLASKNAGPHNEERMEILLRKIGVSFQTPIKALGYTSELARYEALDQSDILIVQSVNAATLTEASILMILYALAKQKVILLSDAETMDEVRGQYANSLICSRLAKFYIGDITQLDPTDARMFVANILQKKKVNYILTKHEIVLIQAALRSYFRSLLAKYPEV